MSEYGQRDSMRLRRTPGTSGVLRPENIFQPNEADPEAEFTDVEEFDSALRSDADALPPIDNLTVTIYHELEGYTQVNLWIKPNEINADPVLGEWTQLVLVRSPAGIPATQHDGVQLIAWTGLPDPPPDVLTYSDTALPPGRWQYYALFARFELTGNAFWLRVGTLDVLLPYEWGYKERLWQWTPEYYRDIDKRSASNPDGLLRKLMNVLGYETDIHRTWASTVGDLWDLQRTAGRLLPYLGNVLGLEYEPEIGDKRVRNLLANLLYLRQRKGTKDSIEGFISAFTGYQCRAWTGKNIVLHNGDYEGRDAEPNVDWEGHAGLGNWNTSNSMLEITSVIDGGQPALRFRNTAGFNVSSTYRLGLYDGSGTPTPYNVFTCIPVIPGNEYRFQAYVRSTVPGMEIVFGATGTSSCIEWSRGDGGYIIGDPDAYRGFWDPDNPDVDYIAGRDVEIPTTWPAVGPDGFPVPNIWSDWFEAPNGTGALWEGDEIARFMAVDMQLSALPPGESVYITGVQVVDRSWRPETWPPIEGDPSLRPDSARRVYVTLYPQRANMAVNARPVIEDLGWEGAVANDYATLAATYLDYEDLLASEDDYADLAAGINDAFGAATIEWLGDYLEFRPAGGGTTARIVSNFFPLGEGYPYSSRVEVRTDVNAIATFYFEWFSDEDVDDLMGVSVRQAVQLDGTFKPYVYANHNPPDGARYGRLSIEVRAGVLTASGGVGSGSGDEFVVGVRRTLIEPTVFPGPYFDGERNTGAPEDFAFLGEDQESFSVYYQNRLVMDARLDDVLPRFIPLDRDYSVLFAPSFIQVAPGEDEPPF